jgi:hypothetical protein
VRGPCYWCSKPELRGFEYQGDFGDVKSYGFGYVSLNVAQRRVALVYKGTGSVAGWVRNFDFDPQQGWGSQFCKKKKN